MRKIKKMIKLIELGLIIYYIQLIGIIINQSYNLIMILIAIELLIFSLVIILINLSSIFDDLIGNILTLFLIPLSGLESAIGLMILIQYYPLKGSLYIK